MANIDELLRNWAAWVRVRPSQGHCASIEHRYRMKSRADGTPTGWGDWLSTPPMAPMPPVDDLSALAVERIMRHLPDGHRKALKLNYVYHMPARLICLRLVIRYADWDRFLGDARAMVRNMLQRHEKRSICSSHKFELSIER